MIALPRACVVEVVKGWERRRREIRATEEDIMILGEEGRAGRGALIAPGKAMELRLG